MTKSRIEFRKINSNYIYEYREKREDWYIGIELGRSHGLSRQSLRMGDRKRDLHLKPSQLSVFLWIQPLLISCRGWLVCVWTWSCWRSCWFPSSVGSVLRVSGPWSFLIKSEDLAVHGQLPEPAEKQEITSLVIFRCFADHRVNVYSLIFVSLISLFWYFQLSSYLFIYYI